MPDVSQQNTTSSFSSVFPIETFGERPCVVMDGGMGTTLQAPPFSQNIDSALWSSELLASKKGRQTLTELHQTWIDVGAECIGSCSYQSFLPLFLTPESANTPEASDVMLSALTCITSSTLTTADPSSSSVSTRGIFPTLSLGPFGALCQPGQEYSGLYPHPFGPIDTPTPSKISYDTEAIELPRIQSLVDRREDPEENELTRFHLRRLNDFAESSEWDRMKLIAFETVPIVKEARAIRRAMQLFNQSGSANARRQDRRRLPFYISFVFPVNEQGEIKYPDSTLKDLSLKEQMDQLVEAMFGQRDQEEQVDGFGINCSNPSRIQEILKPLNEAMSRQADLIERNDRPWLILYPDGGAVYDVFTKTWSNPSGLTEAQWASLLVDNVELSLKLSFASDRDGDSLLWGGAIAGGCCKAGPGAIQALQAELVNRNMIELK